MTATTPHQGRDAWLRTLGAAGEQIRRHGSLARASASTRDWADQQIRLLRAGTVSTADRQALADSGITDHTLTSAERRLLAELDWWIQRHGDARVPQAATSRTVAGTAYRLGARVAEARAAHARGSLNPTLTQELESRAGWAWRVREEQQDRSWDQRCDQLASYVDEHGQLPAATTNLYKWLHRQRRTLDQLPEQRRQRLTEIPGALTGRVDEFVAAARRWLADGPDRTMADLAYADTITTAGHPYPLGRRATYYRRRFHGLEGTHPLRPTEVAAIAGLPRWTWELQERFRRPRAASTGET
jgi:hypothetical protein